MSSSLGEELGKSFCNAQTPEESGLIIKDFFKKLSFAEQVMFLSYVSGFVVGRTSRIRDMEELK